MSNTSLEELEIEELSERLMLKLSPKVVREENFEENAVSAMIIDDECGRDKIDVGVLASSSRGRDPEHRKESEGLVCFEPTSQGQSLRRCKLDSELATRSGSGCSDYFEKLRLSRSNSLPPQSKDSCKGLNLFKSRSKQTSGDCVRGEGEYDYLDKLSRELNLSSYSTGLKRMSFENTQEFIRLIFNLIIVFITLYIIFGIIFVIRNDIESKIQISITNILDEMNTCSKHYVDNKCQPEHRVPAMESKCTEWEKCMSQNPTIIARKSIFTAQIIGEIINTFFDQISFKSALFIFGFIIALIIGNYFVISSAFNFNKSIPHAKSSLELSCNKNN